ncbi:MAG: DNA translocase FtsK 4TM domain-containing protein [bacterium]
MRKRYYFKVKEKNRTKRNELIGFILIAASVLFLFCLLWPQYAGVMGLWLNKKLSFIFGLGKLVFPLSVFLSGMVMVVKTDEKNSFKIAGMLGILWISSTFLSLCTSNAPQKNLGGFVGKYSERFLVQALGRVGAFIILIVVFLFIMHWATHLSLKQIIKGVFANIKDDLNVWKRMRADDKKKKITRTFLPPVLKPAADNFEEELTIQPRIVQTQPHKEHVDEPLKPSKPKSSILMKDKKSKPDEMLHKPLETKVWTLPSIDLLNENKAKDAVHKEDELVSRAAQLENALTSFNIQAKVTDINPGPIITRYDLKLAPGVKVGSIISLSNDLALTMRSSSIRIVAPIPGKAAVGIEIPNSNTVMVSLRDILSSDKFKSVQSKIAMGLGKTTDGQVYCTDLIPMPHLLIAGATGSGKSVCIHSIILSILYKALPTEVKLVLIDPKRLELPIYNGLPHLYDPNASSDEVKVITNPKQASKTLEQLTKIMDDRYERFAKVSARNIDVYNQIMEKNGSNKEYYIVVIIDELADLMLIASRDVEESIQRLAQMARAVGIHLILATQRPSVDVITGVIKANLSARIALQVLSKVDSRVILDMQGAEDLLGRGDMLFLPSGEPKPSRLQGAYVTEKEVERVVSFYKNQGKPVYEDMLVKQTAIASTFGNEETFKNLYAALKLVKERKRVSQDLLKAHFGSSAKATNILSILEIKNFIRKPEGSNRWEIFFDQVDEFLESHSDLEQAAK